MQIDICSLSDTSLDSSTNKAIVDVLAHHSLTLYNVRGKCYYGASNIQDDLGGMKTLIRQEINQLICSLICS